MAQNWFACIAQHYGPWVTAGAILISAGIAIWVMIYNAKIARRRATIDLVLHMRQNTPYLDARKKLVKLQDEGQQLAKYADKDLAESEQSLCIIELLNFSEFVAVGIREKAFDEKVYKRLSRSRYIKDWETLHGYVTELRRARNLSVLFNEFQSLAEQWKAQK